MVANNNLKFDLGQVITVITTNIGKSILKIKHQKINFFFLNNEDNANFEKYEKMQPYITFLNEAFANLFSDYFEEYCFDIQDFSNYRLDESKVINILQNKYKENKIDIEKKDVSIIIDQYSKKIEVRQYFFKFLLYLINLNGFENFKNFISSIYMNETNTIDELFKRYYQNGIVEIFENWSK